MKALEQLRRKELNASFTAEAALLFPILIFIIFSVILVDFYLYDETSAIIFVHRYALKFSESKMAGEGEEMMEKLHKELEEELEDKTLLPRDARVTGEAAPGSIKLSVELEQRSGRMMQITGMKEEQHLSVRSGAMRQADRVRISDIVWNLGEDILQRSVEEISAAG